MVPVFNYEPLVGAECPVVAAGDYFVTHQQPLLTGAEPVA